MKIKYLGTGAAEGIPAVFCECRVCKNARANQGREIRSRSQAIIDDILLIDFGPDSYWHSIRYGIEFSKINNLLITHTHGDHFYYHDIICRKANRFLEPVVRQPLKIYGSIGVKNQLQMFDDENVIRDGNVIFQQVREYEEFHIGEYSVIALPAVHSSESPLVFSVSDGKNSILYCHDSDMLQEESMQYLRDKQMHFDLVSMDCTEGSKHIDYDGHMNFEKNTRMKKLLFEYGIGSENTIIVASHFSHNGLVTYSEADEIAKQIGFVAAYDGMEVVI